MNDLIELLFSYYNKFILNKKKKIYKVLFFLLTNQNFLKPFQTNFKCVPFAICPQIRL